MTRFENADPDAVAGELDIGEPGAEGDAALMGELDMAECV